MAKRDQKQAECTTSERTSEQHKGIDNPINIPVQSTESNDEIPCCQNGAEPPKSTSPIIPVQESCHFHWESEISIRLTFEKDIERVASSKILLPNRRDVDRELNA